MYRTLFISAFSISVFSLSACTQSPPLPEADMDMALRIFETLAADDMQGRATGTKGIEKARDYLKNEIKALEVFDTTSAQVFEFTPRRSETKLVGENLIGIIDTDDNDEGPLLVITAHYDHLGERAGLIYNGADDNASGSAALFAIAKSFKASPPDHDVAFVWFDAEERGLSGARAYVSDKTILGDRPVFNLNLDMVSQNENELYFAGSYHLPALRPLMEKAAKTTNLTLSFGHDSPADGNDDWTRLSDHGVFFDAGIPFGYFGVEDHAHYHKPTDTFETIPQAFYKESVQTLVNAAHILDSHLDKLARPAKRAPLEEF